MKYKKQHWIPRSYLQAWCDPDVPTGQNPYVWIFPKDGGDGRRKGPENIFYESDMYTIRLENGERVLDIEHGLSGLEDLFVKVRENIIYKRQPLENEDRLIILAFIAASFSRTRLQKNHLKEQWGKVLELMEETKRFAETAAPEQLENLASLAPPSERRKGLNTKEVKRLTENPLQETLLSSITTQTELFLPMHLSFLCTKDDPGFITSDAPCVWFDPEAYKRPPFYRSPGLIYRSIEITLPISPSFMAFLTWKPLDLYIDVTENIVDDLNRRTRFYTEEYFVARRNFLKEIWFNPGTPPKD